MAMICTWFVNLVFSYWIHPFFVNFFVKISYLFRIYD